MSQAGIANRGVFPPGTVVETLSGDSGVNPVGPDAANNINIFGSGNITVSGNPGTNTLTITDTTAGGVISITGDVGPAQTGNIILTGGTSGAVFTGAAGTITESFDFLSLPTTTATDGQILINGAPVLHAFGATNTFVGSDAGNFTLTGFSSVGIGSNSLQSLTSGAFNTAGGFLALGSATTGTNNAAWGAGSLSSLVSGGQNTAVGNSSLNTVVTGSGNIALGFSAGSSYAGAESNTIAIGSTGTIADSGTIRIGTSGTHTSYFAAGIAGVNVGSVASVVSLAPLTGQLGETVITAGTGITVTPGANSITISGSGTTTLTYTNVNTTPYVVLGTDEYLGVDSSGGAIQINLPNAPATGRTFIIKDRTGSANTNNITVTTVGGVVNIDGATTYVMNTQYAAINVLFDGSTYQIF